MDSMIMKSSRILTPLGTIDGYVTVEDGKITSVAQGDCPQSRDMVIDVGDNYLSPGFIDMHTHGGGGHDFMDGTDDCFSKAAKAHLLHGTTCMLPTTLTSSMEELYHSIDSFKKAQVELEGGPELLGLHLEGPYFNPLQAGAQDPRYLKSPQKEEYEAILKYADGAIRRWSVAVELDGAIPMGDALQREGIVGSIGHSDAELDKVKVAHQHGYRLLTHFYSAMSGIVRKGGFRHLGIIESGYLLDNMDIEIIADGCHLPPDLLRMICKLKDHTRISLVTDSMRGAGMPDGPSVLGSLKDGQEVVIEDGVAKLLDRSAFAGSVATADRLVRVMHQQAGLTIDDAVKMMTENPARVLGVADRKGKIAPGYDADLVVFDEDIKVSCVVCKGVVTKIPCE